MSLIKQLKETFLFIFNDFKNDIYMIKRIAQGKAKFQQIDISQISLKEVVEENWIWAILCIGFFFAGMFWANQQCANLCTAAIQEHIIPQVEEKCMGKVTHQEILDWSSIKPLPSPSIPISEVTNNTG